MSRVSHYTPHSSAASHGRITTQNSDLVALLRENSRGPQNVSVDSHALNVVTNSELSTNNHQTAHSSENIDNHQETVDNTSYHKSRQNTYDPVVKGNARPSSRPRSLVDAQQKQTAQNTPSQALPDNELEHVVVNQEQFSAQSKLESERLESPENTPHHRYSYKSLKSIEHSSRESLHSGGVVAGTAHALDVRTGDREQFNAQSEIKAQNSDIKASKNNNALDSKSGTLVLDNSQRQGQSLHENPSQLDHRASSHQKSGLNHNIHDNNTVKTIKSSESIANVPKLDLSKLSPAHNSPISASDSETETISSHAVTQNLHISEADKSKSPILHFSAHDKFATGRTYEVESPVEHSDLPQINSSNNFRDREGSQLGEQDTYRDREQGPEKLTPGHSDLANDLVVPYPFDTQAHDVELEKENKPPSPPNQVSPPPDKEPATSLRSNSKVYAVSNPEILRAQGINPAPDTQFTPRQYSNAYAKNRETDVHDSRSASRSRYDQDQVRFDQSADQRRTEIYGETPVRERAPTPYAHSPAGDRLSPGELHTKSPTDWETPRDQTTSRKSERGRLPPQHPPLDTKPPSRDTNIKDDTISIKRVYVESPSFTKEEEEEYRFVSSRIDDIEEKDKQGTFREMEDKGQRGYGGDDNHNGYSKAAGDFNRQGREYDRQRDSYDSRPRENERNGYSQDRYEDRNREINGYAENRANEPYDDRNKYRSNYEKENRPYSEKKDNYENERRQNRDKQDNFKERREQFSDKDSYERNKYGYNKESDPFERQERYEHLQDERDKYDKEKERYPEQAMNGRYQKQTTEMDLEDLQQERAYQKDLQRRLEYEKSKDNELVIPRAPLQESGNYQSDNFVRDSLEYPDDRNRHNFARDSLEYDGYTQRSRDWGQPPQNPFGDFEKQSSKPDFYDPVDAERMEIVNPPIPRVDYVEKNKFDYGFTHKKSYRDIDYKKREESEKLDHMFITPKVPPKHIKPKHGKKTQSAQPEHMGYQPPPQEPVGGKPSSAEELWAQRSSFLARKSSTNGSANAGKAVKSAGKTVSKGWNSNPRVKQPYTYQAPVPLPNQGQIYKPQNVSRTSSGGNQGYTTPTKLQPLENKPQPPAATDLPPTAVEPNSPFRRHLELKPIRQELITEDGQHISLDINLRLVSPPPGHSSPRGSQQQLALVPVQETQGPAEQRGIGVAYQMQDQYGGYQPQQQQDDVYGNSYQQVSTCLTHLTLNAPIATKVVCFSRLLKCLRSLYGKQCGPRSDCSYRSSLFCVHTVCFYT